MFQNCSSLTSLDFSTCTNLTQIWWYAFDGCSSLQTIDLSGATLSIIGNKGQNLNTVFSGCSSLTKIYVKDAQSKSLIDSALSASGLSTDICQIKS